MDRIGLTLVFSSSAVAAAVLGASPAMAQTPTGCEALRSFTLPASAIGLPSSGAVITSADPVAQADPLPAFCKVLGKINPVDPAAPPVLFEVNLPANWNGKAVQLGGGGVNGRLVTGLDALGDAPPGAPGPLARGFVTLGTDGGHEATDPTQQFAFALNEEALINHAYGAYKKTHDVAMALVKAFYGRVPRKTYYVGTSEGGREAMLAAQRFPQDYDAVSATVPVLDWVGVNLSGYQIWKQMRDGGWLSPAKVALVEKSSAAACDAADGLEDGVFAKYTGCNADSQLQALRCAGGADTGDACLSDKQIALVKRVRSPLQYGFAINHGELSYPPFPTGEEANPGGFIPFMDQATPPAPTDPSDSLFVGDVRYFITQDPKFSGDLDLAKYKDRIQKVSGWMDMNDPDLARFRARGGKMLIVDHGADYLVAPSSVYRYYDSVVGRFGQGAADSFIRFYVAPNINHFGTGRSATTGAPTPDRYDSLSLLDAWADQGVAPPDQVVLTAYARAATPTAGASWPMCRYPAFPHYTAGDPKSASSYACRK